MGSSAAGANSRCRFGTRSKSRPGAPTVGQGTCRCDWRVKFRQIASERVTSAVTGAARGVERCRTRLVAPPRGVDQGHYPRRGRQTVLGDQSGVHETRHWIGVSCRSGPSKFTKPYTRRVYSSSDSSARLREPCSESSRAPNVVLDPGSKCASTGEGADGAGKLGAEEGEGGG
jgi:hypothetical protein